MSRGSRRGGTNLVIGIPKVNISKMSIPGFLTLEDQREFTKKLKARKEIKNFNLLTNLYMENDDPNYHFNNKKVRIYDGKYFKTYLVDSNLGKFPIYNHDPKSKEIQKLIEDSTKSTNYFKIGNFYINSTQMLDLKRVVKIKQNAGDDTDLLNSSIYAYFIFR